jgi:YD repeat-containing protein
VIGSGEDRRLIEVVDGLNQSTRYSYNIHGSVLNIDAPGTSGDRSYFYNAKNFLVQENNPESGMTTYVRNEIGQPTSKTATTPTDI